MGSWQFTSIQDQAGMMIIIQKKEKMSIVFEVTIFTHEELTNE